MTQCPQCHAPVAAGDADAVTGLARCRGCDEVFRLPRPELPAKAKEGPPAGITVAGNAHGHTLRYEWFSPWTFSLTLWSGAWIAAMSFARLSPDPRVGPGARAVITGLLGFGILLAYRALAEWLNATTVTLGDGFLRVRNGPVPWTGAIDLPAESVRQLYAYDGRMPEDNARESALFSVRALLRDGTTRTVASNLTSPAAARYVEHSLEAWLGLADEPVPEELTRPRDAPYPRW